MIRQFTCNNVIFQFNEKTGDVSSQDSLLPSKFSIQDYNKFVAEGYWTPIDTNNTNLNFKMEKVVKNDNEVTSFFFNSKYINEDYELIDNLGNSYYVFTILENEGITALDHFGDQVFISLQELSSFEVHNS